MFFLIFADIEIDALLPGLVLFAIGGAVGAGVYVASDRLCPGGSPSGQPC
ncbi:hypothetical protein [Actinoplanes sp. TFC3]|nr:hypothetical protein [Actinoplanes sp. TFC3]